MTSRPMPGGWSTAVSSWLSWLRASGRPESTIKLRTTQLRRLAEAHPDRAPYSLSVDDLAEWLGAHAWAAETLRSHRAAVRGFYTWAHATGRAHVNPAAFLPTVKAAEGKPRPAPDPVIRSSRLRADPRDERMIRLASEAGLRSCEICKVHTDDVEPDMLGWSLRVKGKGGRVRLVPLSDGLASMLRNAPPGYVFPGRIEGHLSAAYVSKRLSRALDGDYTGHQLRHRFGSVAYSAERDLRAVQELLGHTRPETTARYVLVPDGAKRTAVMAAAS
ncbi:tyrosine-type recombinase/integrase [Sinomonas sp. ASV322]|uniref:tyrosine-type recombinase/integrase n=1 Tax=Sinomonas sp. ASV322 TaxID=3041920 RepID=UPI0027DDEC32|nr:tyrosine-type recombinase/integrase [Sinomonas sp. ASV322]MDQ4502207.1 tyrosine-type recombinase/integrase [Sinomonas sp. ASV322]